MKYKILELLKKSEDFISGEYIGLQLNITRAAVWKNILKLKEEGYEIESVSNKGYRLIQPEALNILNKYEINIENCVFVSEVDSTNLEAKRIVQAPFEDKLLVVCNKQLNGRGRLGRAWEDMGENVCMSYIFKPNITPMDAQQFTLISGLAIADAITEFTGLKCGIKWPNDIILNDKKLVGILTEMNAEMEHINYIIVGIGINVNCVDFPTELKNKATSLALELGYKVKRSLVVECCAEKMFGYYDRFCKYGFNDFIAEYNEKCINMGKMVKAIYKNHQLTGIAKGIDVNGGLIILDDKGNLTTVTSGEVSLRFANNKYI